MDTSRSSESPSRPASIKLPIFAGFGNDNESSYRRRAFAEAEAAAQCELPHEAIAEANRCYPLPNGNDAHQGEHDQVRCEAVHVRALRFGLMKQPAGILTYPTEQEVSHETSNDLCNCNCRRARYSNHRVLVAYVINQAIRRNCPYAVVAGVAHRGQRK
jgi:hypothetical protein